MRGPQGTRQNSGRNFGIRPAPNLRVAGPQPEFPALNKNTALEQKVDVRGDAICRKVNTDEMNWFVLLGYKEIRITIIVLRSVLKRIGRRTIIGLNKPTATCL